MNTIPKQLKQTPEMRRLQRSLKRLIHDLEAVNDFPEFLESARAIEADIETARKEAA